MTRLWWVLGVLAVAASAVAQGGQGGFGGGGFGGGGFGGAGIGGSQRDGQATRNEIDSRVDNLLRNRQTSSILTPGEYVEWDLKLKAGQLIYADASSSVFDPALEVFDGQQVVAENDDRYPGDQRPLLMWRSEQAGDFKLRLRSFRGRAGGAAQVRFRVFDTITMVEGRNDLEVESDSTLLRLPLRARQAVLLISRSGSNLNWSSSNTLAPPGIPLRGFMNSVNIGNQSPIYAPVSGDYYVNVSESSGSKISLDWETVQPTTIELGKSYTEAKPRALGAWTLKLKAGEIVEVSVDGVKGYFPLMVRENVDLIPFDEATPEHHPFAPVTSTDSKNEPPFKSWYTRLPTARSVAITATSDTSVRIFAVMGKTDIKSFRISVRSATKSFDQAAANGNLLPGTAQIFEFEAKASEVYRIRTTNQNFLMHFNIIDPTLEPAVFANQVEDEALQALLVVRKTGRHLVFVNSVGYGGGGSFSLERVEIKPRITGMGAPAAGVLAPGETQVWTYVAQPDRPMLVRWKSSSGSVPLTAVDDAGEPVKLPLTIQRIDEHTQISFWFDERPKTYRLVVTNPTDKPLDYRIEFSDLPQGTVSNGGMK